MTDRSRADRPATRRVGFSASASPSSVPRAGTSERLTLRTLAMSLNLSTSAVSLVLNASAGAERIPAVTRERILAAARGLHYRPNVLAQSLRRRRSFAIGVLVPDLGAAWSALAQAITDTLRVAGYEVLLAMHHRCSDPIAARARLMFEQQVDGLGHRPTPRYDTWLDWGIDAWRCCPRQCRSAARGAEP